MIFRCGEAFSHSKRKCPYPLVASGDPFRERGLGLLSVLGFLCRSKEIPKKKTLILEKLHSKLSKQKQNTKTAPHRITSVGDQSWSRSESHFESESPWGRSVTPAGSEKHPPSGRKPASGGCFYPNFVMGKHFCMEAKMPLPFGRFLRTLFAKRVLEAVSFQSAHFASGEITCRPTRKRTPKNFNFRKTSF